MSYLLHVERLRIAFQGREVVHGVEFGLREGEKLALVGESGSGKSVTALSLLGLAQGAQVTGRAVWQGKDLLRMSDAALQQIRGSEIAMIFQEPMTALNPLFTIGHQIAEVLELKRGMSRRASQLESIQLMEKTGLSQAARLSGSYPHQLSGGQRQRAMIAMALAGQPRLLLADEPTTALDVNLRGQILQLLNELQQETGMAILMITHDLPMVRQFAQQVVVMEQGHLIESGTVSQVFIRPVEGYTKRLIHSVPVRNVRPAQDDDPVVLQAKNLSISYPARGGGLKSWWRQPVSKVIDQLQLELRQGQTLGVIGESGSGKSTLAMALLGLLPFEGDIELMGRRWFQGKAADKALRKQIQVVFQDPFSSLSPRMTVGELVGEGLKLHFPQLTPQQHHDRLIQVLAEVGLQENQFAGLLNRYPHEFSGGQRQRLSIARALAVEPAILVLDEPTSALDVSIQSQVLSLLQDLQARKQLSYLLISHDIAVVDAMAHQVVVLHQGRIVSSRQNPSKSMI
jgi:microcin C transport system ATP-binding protein